MNVTLEQIRHIFRAELQAELLPLREEIANLKQDNSMQKLQILQQEYLQRDILTISEVTKAQLLGHNYTKKTVKTKLGKAVFNDGASNRDKVWTSAVIEYREKWNVQL